MVSTKVDMTLADSVTRREATMNSRLLKSMAKGACLEERPLRSKGWNRSVIARWIYYQAECNAAQPPSVQLVLGCTSSPMRFRTADMFDVLLANNVLAALAASRH